jgi:5-methylcytosine-specific restriction endonuclease McrA
MSHKMTCATCGNQFVRAWQGERPNAPKYCNRTCFGIAQRKRSKAVCPTCKKEFEVIPSRKKASLKNYCSPSCRSQGVMQRGPMSPNWKGGSEGTQARAIRRLHGTACMRCGGNEARTDTHHIKLRSKGGKHALANLLVLCPNCHRLAHDGKIPVETLREIRDRFTP